MQQQLDYSELYFRDSAIPGGTLVNALWHRDLMRLSDRGRASELVGDRWAELCAEALDTWIGAPRSIPVIDEGPKSYNVERIARLDDIPAIASAASREKLQNPDFLLIGHCEDTQIVQPADAKFSVETAKSKQVSADVAASLILLGPVVTDHVTNLREHADVTDGFFLCPDFSLTHYMLHRHGGPRGGVTVPREQIELLPVTAPGFMESLDGRDLALWLGELDGFPISPSETLLLFLYYFRVARACVGCWIDQTAPLLAYKDVPTVDMAAVTEVAVQLGGRSSSAWQIVLTWDAIADQVRRQRVAIDHAASMPLTSGELRSRIEAFAKRAGIVAPSPTRVRRAIGSWFRSRMREEYGAIHPPVDNLPALLKDLSGTAHGLRPELLFEVEQVVLQTGTETNYPTASTSAN